MGSILDETRNFLRAYRHHCGVSEVPEDFHLWSGLSLIAACVQDRVWVEKFRGEALVPNLYVLLIGPSGSGKGKAISPAIRFAVDRPRIHLYSGNATKQFLIDELSRKRRRTEPEEFNPAKLWFVATELGDDVPSGPYGEELIRFLTKVYDGAVAPIQEGTRTHGLHTIIKPCLNVLLGTTREWLIRSVPRDAIEGGFFGRIACVEATYTPVRVTNPQAPQDDEAVVAWLQRRVDRYLRTAGEFLVDAEAQQSRELWYQHRPEPEDERLLPAFHRQDDLCFKLAMLFCLAEGGPMIIRKDHMGRAQKQSEIIVERMMPGIMDYAAMTVEMDGVQKAARLIRRAGRLRRDALLKRLGQYGIHAAGMDVILPTLIQSGRIVVERRPTGGLDYVWKQE